MNVSARMLIVAALALIIQIHPARLKAADKKEEAKKDPVIHCVSPFALVPGQTKSLKIRGLALDSATSAKLTGASGKIIPATIKSKAKSDPPKPYEAGRAGDSEVQLELKLPADAQPGDLSLILTTPVADTKPFPLAIADPASTIAEKEPNNGFKNAQDLPLGKTLLGLIENTSDVDVFRIGGHAGMKIIVRITADSKGSLLDGSLTLYDSAGHVLATADDNGESRDPLLQATLPADGTYFLSLTDANDHGSAFHAYALTVTEQK